MTLRDLYYNYTGYPNVYEDGGLVGRPSGVQLIPIETKGISPSDAVNPNAGNKGSGNKFLDFMNNNGGGGWANAIGPAATNIANAFLDTEASTADRVAGAMGIPALANQWQADTSKGDAYIKDMQNSMDLSSKNYIQDASSSWGGANAVKQNLKTNISPISFNSAVPSLKDFKGNWWKNMGASVAQGAASGSVGGPWGALGGAVTGLFGSIGGLFGRKGRAERAYKDFLAKRKTLVSAQEAAYNRAVTDQTLSNMQAIANGNISQRINDMANIRAFGGNLFANGGSIIDPNPPFDDWYKTVPNDRNDTTSYNLRRAYELAPKEDLENWRTATPDELISGEKHLNSVYYNEGTGEYEFMKSKNHPTLKYELDWYYGDTPEATDFRKKYNLDKSGEYYKYIPNNTEYAMGGNLYPDGGTIKEGNEEVVQEPVYEGGELPEITVSAESMPWYEKIWNTYKRNIINPLIQLPRRLTSVEAQYADSYDSKDYTFNEAYEDARNKGQKTFFWDNNYYNTDYEGIHGKQYKQDVASGKATNWEQQYPNFTNPELRKEKQEELNTYGITNEQTRNKTPLDYLLQNIPASGYNLNDAISGIRGEFTTRKNYDTPEALISALEKKYPDLQNTHIPIKESGDIGNVVRPENMSDEDWGLFMDDVTKWNMYRRDNLDFHKGEYNYLLGFPNKTDSDYAGSLKISPYKTGKLPYYYTSSRLETSAPFIGESGLFNEYTQEFDNTKKRIEELESKLSYPNGEEWLKKKQNGVVTEDRAAADARDEQLNKKYNAELDKLYGDIYAKQDDFINRYYNDDNFRTYWENNGIFIRRGNLDYIDWGKVKNLPKKDLRLLGSIGYLSDTPKLPVLTHGNYLAKSAPTNYYQEEDGGGVYGKGKYTNYIDFIRNVIGKNTDSNKYDASNIDLTSLVNAGHLGTYTLGIPENNQYISIYDKFDINPFGSGNDKPVVEIGSPYEYYTRFYRDKEPDIDNLYENLNNTKAMGGNLYTDLSPNMMNLWNNKQQIDQQKVMNQQMNFGLGNSFNYKNMFPNGGGLNNLGLRAYLSQQGVENAKRAEAENIKFYDRYRNDWGDRTPDYANMSEQEFLQESRGLHDNPNIIGLPLSDYNKYQYRKFLYYPNNTTFKNGYLFMPSIEELREKYPLKDLPVYKKNGSWYLKEGIPASNGYKNLKEGGHKIPNFAFQDTIDELRRRAFENEFYESVHDYKYDDGKDLPNPIKFEGNPNLYYKENGKYINDKGEEWSAGDFSDIRQMLRDGLATDPNKEESKSSKREAYLKYKREQEERAKNRQEEGHVDDYWHKDIDDNFMSNPVVEHDEVVVIGDKSKKSDNVEYRPTQRQIGYKKLAEDLGGSEGVKKFQEEYNLYHPESPIKIDGKVGDETVRAFQSWNNEYGSDNVYGLAKLDVDGIYGNKSQEFMSSGIAKRNLMFANGGNLFAGGGQINSSDLPDNAQYYANGGTHEENPYGGIQVGTDQQGNPNLVEEGEFRWGDYIFSDRINVDPTLLSRYNLAPATKHQGKKANKGKLSYADMAKKYAKKNNELANDPIGKNTLEAYMKRLQDAQEDQKFQDQIEQQKQDAINQYRNALTTPQQGNPMYGAMKYSGMGNAATQQGVNAGMSDLGQQGSGNEVLSNTNRSGNNMLHAMGGNLYWRGSFLKKDPPPYGDPNSRIDYAMRYLGTPTYNGNSRIDFANQYMTDADKINDYGVSDFMNRIYSGNVGFGSPKSNTTVTQTKTPQNFQEWALWQHDNGNNPYVGSANTGVEPDAFALQAQGITANGSTADADYTTGYNGTTNTNTGSTGLTDNIKTGNTTTGTYATNAFKEDPKQVPHYSTAGEYAMFGKGLTPMIWDWMNKTNTKYDPKQRPANELVNMGNNSTFLRTADTIGGYRASNLMDAERMNNAAQAQGLAALQTALSTGNGNREFAAVQANQQMYNTGMVIGNNYATAQQANNEERYKTDAHNTAIDQFNANARNASYQDNQKAQQIGQQMALSAKQAANDYLQKENWYADRTNRTAMDNRATNQAAWTDNALNYFITQAQENAERNRQNNDITKRYWSDKDGVMHYIGDSGLNGKIREYFRKNNIDNGTFTGDRLAAFNSIIQNNKAKDVVNEKGELWSTVQGLMDDEIAARNKEIADADKAKADELQEYRDQFDSELAQLGRYAANKDIYGNYWTSSGDLDYYGKEGFRDSQSLSQLKRAIEMLRTHNDRYNKWTPQNVTAYGGRINNGNKNNKNGYYTYTY